MDKEELRRKRKEAYQKAKTKRDADPKYQALKEKMKRSSSMPKGKGKISTKTLDEKFDEGKEDILQYFDTNTASRRILVDFPEWMLESLDNEATHLGISRQAVIKFWINEKIREISPNLRKAA